MGKQQIVLANSPQPDGRFVRIVFKELLINTQVYLIYGTFVLKNLALKVL